MLEAFIEIAGRFYARMPGTAIVLGLLLSALAAHILYAIQHHARLLFTEQGRRASAMAKAMPPAEWQRRGGFDNAWTWHDTDAQSNAAQVSESRFSVGYAGKGLLLKCVIGLTFIAIMGYYTLASLPYLDASFLTQKGGGVFLLAPCIPILYSGWMIWRTFPALQRYVRQLPAYRITDEHIEIGGLTMPRTHPPTSSDSAIG